jgi:predicted transcriptional regulator
MATTMDRKKLLKVVKTLPEDCSLEEAVYRIQLWASIEAAEADIAAGRVYTQAEVERRLRAKWQRRRK